MDRATDSEETISLKDNRPIQEVKLNGVNISMSQKNYDTADLSDINEQRKPGLTSRGREQG